MVFDTAITTLNMAIGNLEKQLEIERGPREAVFPNDKPYDVYETIRSIFTAVTRELTIVDPYVDGTLFTLLGNVAPATKIRILTQSMQGDFELAGKKFKVQHEKSHQGILAVRKCGKLHDRFIIADDKIFHMGASIKDAGNKMCAMSEFEGSDIKDKLSVIISDFWEEAEIVL